MVSINPLDVLLWTFRRNEKDVINLYSSLSPVMQLATGGSMLNFGYWSSQHVDPLSAQNNLCMTFADFADLSSAKSVVDVGSGLSAPSQLWRDNFPNLKLYDININFKQLLFVGKQKSIEFINSSSLKIPLAEHSVDRVLALESAQHFKPLSDFISESKRILVESGLLVLAIPVVAEASSLRKLGLLQFTWSSEHYSLAYLKDIIDTSGFKISDERLIGHDVYVPLANYYEKNRTDIKKLISKNYPQYVENILFKSIQKMKKASEENLIEYALIKCTN